MEVGSSGCKHLSVPRAASAQEAVWQRGCRHEAPLIARNERQRDGGGREHNEWWSVEGCFGCDGGGSGRKAPVSSDRVVVVDAKPLRCSKREVEGWEWAQSPFRATEWWWWFQTPLVARNERWRGGSGHKARFEQQSGGGGSIHPKREVEGLVLGREVEKEGKPLLVMFCVICLLEDSDKVVEKICSVPYRSPSRPPGCLVNGESGREHLSLQVVVSRVNKKRNSERPPFISIGGWCTGGGRSILDFRAREGGSGVEVGVVTVERECWQCLALMCFILKISILIIE